MSAKKSSGSIVQFSDESKTLPDGSKVIYAENDDKIVLYHKKAFEKGITYIFDRKNNAITINNKKGSNQDKLLMIQLGSYFLNNSSEKDLVTLDIFAETP